MKESANETCILIGAVTAQIIRMQVSFALRTFLRILSFLDAVNAISEYPIGQTLKLIGHYRPPARKVTLKIKI